MKHTTLTLAAAMIAAGFIGFGSPLAANAMMGATHHHHHLVHFRHARHYHYACDYRRHYHGISAYRHHCLPYRHMRYGYMNY